MVSEESPLMEGKNFKHEYVAYLDNRQKSLNIVHTTKTRSGQILDWVPKDSQTQSGLATPPPAPAETHLKMKSPVSELQLPGAEHGPEGTVPIKRPDFSHLDFKIPLKEHFSKSSPPQLKDLTLAREGAASQVDPQPQASPHWYASSHQFVTNYGCEGRFSCYAPTTKDSDFSLIQLGVIRNEGAKRPDRPDGSSTTIPPGHRNDQTLEAGWIRYKGLFGNDLMYLFSYYTTCGYEIDADYCGGWTEHFKGWVQHDRDLYPGCSYSPYSVVGGEQHEMYLKYELYQGNWWLWCIDRWLGYYPASLFISNPRNLSAAADPSTTLADHADSCGFWGEVYDAGDNNPPTTSTTTTDMGSGQFAETRWGHSAYIRNLSYQSTVNVGSITKYNGFVDNYNYDKRRYDIETHFDNTDGNGSYMFLGGPGNG